MILLELFAAFFLIGLVSFGGGYAMIPLIRETAVTLGWLNEEEMVNLIAVSESTPGPIAVNAATFIGAKEAGLAGSAAATLGVILPSFIIILLLSMALGSLLEKRVVRNFLSGVRPCVVALIIATAVTLSFSIFEADGRLEWRSVVVFTLLMMIHIFLTKVKGRTPSPILMIIFSAVIGIVLWGFVH